MSDAPKSSLSSKPRRRIYCGKCQRHLFNIVVTMANPPVGAMGVIENFQCPHCGHESMLVFGAADKDRRGDAAKVEERLRESMAADAKA